MSRADDQIRTDRELGRSMDAELRSQPDCWTKAAGLHEQGMLPAAGARVAIVGCGTSWFMAQSYAVLRESGGHGLTDAFTAAEAFPTRDYDCVVALSRSGTTTDVVNLMAELRGRVRTVAIVADTGTALAGVVDGVIGLPFADEQSVVQTRFATTALALLRCSLGEDLSGAISDARFTVQASLDEALVSAEQYTFLGTGWSVGLANEAGLKMREASRSWTESYPAGEYRHGPISIAEAGRVTWMLGTPPAGLADSVSQTGARFETSALDPMADLIRIQRVALERARRSGLDPDAPRNLTRSVILG